jgi:hypothetical protein
MPGQIILRGHGLLAPSRRSDAPQNHPGVFSHLTEIPLNPLL